jgi:hypothetical protein
LALATVVALAMPTHVEAADVANQAGTSKSRRKQTCIRISKETTYLTEPLDADGYVDYLEALNRESSRGVTPENNFEVVVRRFLGGEAIDQSVRAQYFRRLGVAETRIRRGSVYYQNLKAFVESRPRDKDGEVTAFRDFSAARTRPWSRRDYPLIADWLDQNSAALDAIADGSRRPRSYTPYLAPLGESGRQLPNLFAPCLDERRDLAWAFSARAMHRLNAGNVPSAWSDLEAVHRIARHTASGALDVDAITARAIEVVACRGDVTVLEFGGLNSSHAKNYESELRSLAPLSPVERIFDRYERFKFLEAVALYARESTPHGAVFGPVLVEMVMISKVIDWSSLLQWGNKQIDQYCSTVRMNDPMKQRRSWQAIVDQFRREQNKAGTANNQLWGLFVRTFRTDAAETGFGLLLTPQIFEAMQGSHQRAETWLRLTRLAFLLTAYRLDHRQSPDRLDNLVPGYLARIPADPFTGGSFIYRSQSDGFLIYSVGPNGEDDAGRSEGPVAKSGRAADDIAIRLFVLLN